MKLFVREELELLAVGALALAAAGAFTLLEPRPSAYSTGGTLDVYAPEPKRDEQLDRIESSLGILQARLDGIEEQPAAGGIDPAMLGIVDQGTAQKVVANGFTLRSTATYGNNELVGSTCVIGGQARVVTANTGATDFVSVEPYWQHVPEGQADYICFASAPSFVNSWQLESRIEEIRHKVNQLERTQPVVQGVTAAEIAEAVADIQQRDGVMVSELASDALVTWSSSTSTLTASGLSQ